MRNKIAGTPERPRLSVCFSNKHIYAQCIDDTVGKTLVALCTTSKELNGEKILPNVAGAQALGVKFGDKLKSAGVSAVPMAARVSQKVGQSENPSNFLLMHAMGPNVAGVIGSAVAAGVLLSVLG